MRIAPIAPVYLCTDPTLYPTQTRDLAPVVAFLAAAFTFSYCWKQRKRRAEQALAQQTQRGGGATYRSQYSSAGGPRLFAPQAPPPVHNGLNSPYIYDTTPGFAPVRETSVLTSTFSH